MRISFVLELRKFSQPVESGKPHSRQADWGNSLLYNNSLTSATSPFTAAAITIAGLISNVLPVDEP